MDNHSKKLFKERFDSLFKGKRLLAIHLDGFSHSVIFDDGSKGSQITSVHFSSYCDSKETPIAKLFDGFPHYAFQGNAQEIIWVMPNKR